MKEVATNINGRIGSLEFDLPALKTSIAQMGRPVDEPKFVDKMRQALVRHANSYRNDLSTPREVYRSRAEDIQRQPDSLARTVLLVQKQLAENNRANLATTRKAFRLLGQDKAVLDVEIAVASNYIMQDLGKK